MAYNRSDEYSMETNDALKWTKVTVAALITFLIIFNNVINLIVLWRINEICMRIKILLLSLSTSDISLGFVVCLPGVASGILGYWPFGLAMCQITGAMNGVGIAVSLWSLTAISVERCIVMRRPHISRRKEKRLFSVQVGVAFIWLFTVFFFSLPIFLEPDFLYYKYESDVMTCSFRWKSSIYFLAAKVLYPWSSGAALVITNLQVHKVLKKAEAARKKWISLPSPESRRVSRSPSVKTTCPVTLNGSCPVFQKPHVGDQDVKHLRSDIQKTLAQNTLAVPNNIPLSSSGQLHGDGCQNGTGDCIDPNKNCAHCAERKDTRIEKELGNNGNIVINTVSRSNLPQETGDALKTSSPVVAPRTSYSSSAPLVSCQKSVRDNAEPKDVPEPSKISALWQRYKNRWHERKSDSTTHVESSDMLKTDTDTKNETVHKSLLPRSTIRRENKAKLLLLCTSVVFFTATSPYMVLSMAEHFSSSVSLPGWVRFLALWLLNTNSFVNVFIYSAVYKEFRMHCRLLLNKILCRQQEILDLYPPSSSTPGDIPSGRRIPSHGSASPFKESRDRHSSFSSSARSTLFSRANHAKGPEPDKSGVVSSTVEVHTHLQQLKLIPRDDVNRAPYEMPRSCSLAVTSTSSSEEKSHTCSLNSFTVDIMPSVDV